MIWKVIVPPGWDDLSHLLVIPELTADQMWKVIGEFFDLTGKEYRINQDEPWTMHIIDKEE
jgi:hypothetical protein